MKARFWKKLAILILGYDIRDVIESIRTIDHVEDVLEELMEVHRIHTQYRDKIMPLEEEQRLYKILDDADRHLKEKRDEREMLSEIFVDIKKYMENENRK